MWASVVRLPAVFGLLEQVPQDRPMSVAGSDRPGHRLGEPVIYRGKGGVRRTPALEDPAAGADAEEAEEDDDRLVLERKRTGCPNSLGQDVKLRRSSQGSADKDIAGIERRMVR